MKKGKKEQKQKEKKTRKKNNKKENKGKKKKKKKRKTKKTKKRREKNKKKKYVLNLIDTPGHVDFSYEVSRSIAACEGALLIVDAAQGIQAQTISNLYLALEHDLTIIPILNKIDLPSADPELVKDQIVDLLGCDREEIMAASGKTGLGVHEMLAAIVERIPAPKGEEKAPLQALIFDSVFNPFRGIIAYFRIYNGEIKKGEKIKFVNTGGVYNADEIGVLRLKPEPRDIVKTGDVGYIISGIKEAKEVKVGDTITTMANPCEQKLFRVLKMLSQWYLLVFIQ